MTSLKLIAIAFFSLLLTLVGGCQSGIPAEIRASVDNAPSVDQVRQNPGEYMQQGVRWGGLILDIENRQDTSRLTVMGLPLNDNGKPSTYETSPGRFIAQLDSFIEPLEYARDRRITFIGTIVGTETLKVGEYPYAYPVIQVDQHYLWPKTVPVNSYPPYWRYDPWYYPAYSPWYHPFKPYPIRLVPHRK